MTLVLLSSHRTEEATGIAQVSISRFESGAKTPTLATLYKLAEAYGIDVCELLPKKPKGKK